MRTRQCNEEVLFTTEKIVKLGSEDVQELKHQARYNQRKRIRLCAQAAIEDSLHEMFIIHAKGTYVRPHKHLAKIESFHVIEGTVDVVVFDDAGNITGITKMGDYQSGGTFYHRISEPAYHTLLITSDVCSSTQSNGFRREDTIYAPWSPGESDVESASKFMEELAQLVALAPTR